MDKEKETKDQMLSGIGSLIKSINEFLNEIGIMNKELDRVKRAVSNEGLSCYKLNNIAITYNNKLVELFQLYKRKNVLLSDSCLKYAFINYFVELVAKATACTEKYLALIAKINEVISNINKKNPLFRRRALMKNKELLLQLIGEVEKTLDEYNNCDQKLFCFNLEKDILKLYEAERELFETLSEGTTPTEPDLFIQSCNEELTDLGIEQKIGKFKEDEYLEMKKLPTIEELRKILYQTINSVQEKYEKFPIVTWTILNRISDNFELIKRAYATKNYELYKKVSDRITGFNYLDLSTWIVDIVGETLSFYGISYEELGMLKNELKLLGFEDKWPEIERNIAEEKYDEYVKEQTRLLDSSKTKKLIIPVFTKK